MGTQKWDVLLYQKRNEHISNIFNCISDRTSMILVYIFRANPFNVSKYSTIDDQKIMNHRWSKFCELQGAEGILTLYDLPIPSHHCPVQKVGFFQSLWQPVLLPVLFRATLPFVTDLRLLYKLCVDKNKLPCVCNFWCKIFSYILMGAHRHMGVSEDWVYA